MRSIFLRPAGFQLAGKMLRGLEMATMKSESRISACAHIRRVSAGRNDMKRFCAASVVAAVVAFGGWASIWPARAAPPTVTPSPGYDARLEEQRAARTMYEP